RYRWMVLASPAWLAAHGRPQSIDELHQHRAVGYLNHRTGRTIDWLFSLDEGVCAIRMRETLVVDDTDAYIQAGIQGLGLIRVASYLAQPYLQSGALVACLEQA
ncbi:LysR substrate-binding domain-containing protein, partial [Escherichia coli]|uniref:LysR substrate-binding domain-containing protein n=1 Tax=Escherichia coli TaxID=562 RepID=UPI00234C6DDA